MKPKFCPSNCIHLDLDEEEQNQVGSKYDHWCDKYKSRLFHFSFHPNIVRHESCNGPEYKKIDYPYDLVRLAQCPGSTGQDLAASSTGQGLSGFVSPLYGTALINVGTSVMAQLTAEKAAANAHRKAGEAALKNYQEEMKRHIQIKNWKRDEYPLDPDEE